MADTMGKPPDTDNGLHYDDMASSSVDHENLDTMNEQHMLSDDLPPLETVRKMIQYETHLRLSDAVQELFDLYHKDDNAISMVLELVQQHVVEHFGYRHVNALRSAISRFPDDPVINEAFYIKHNKITQGRVNQGQCAQDVNLFTLDGKSTTLLSAIAPGQPLVVLAGSTT